ncbi:MAG: hypothetical protein J1F02_01310 [Lachnospiraceae bacterium]|nr:hypothetical protein [Lachnospiraceae bacterium]
MSEINNFSDYANPWDSTPDYSALFGSVGGSSSSGAGNVLGDYTAIRNGSYKKLLKAYYAQQKTSESGDSSANLTLTKGYAEDLKKSVETLMDSSLWEKKKIKKKDEETGEEIEVEDYDRDAIAKAVENFANAYNKLVEKTGESDTKDILREAVWMTGKVGASSKLLEKVGITVTAGNKLEIDKDKLNSADINDLKTLFTGHNSMAAQIAKKAGNIINAAARANGTYTKTGTYSNVLSQLASDKVDKEV